MLSDLLKRKKKISVTGLGYVGLPLALEFGKHFSVIGYDIDKSKIERIQNGEDPSKELESSAFNNVDVHFTSDPSDLKKAHFHIVAVPTDIDEQRIPDLRPLIAASKTVGQALKPGDIVVYESTVYPGCTEDDCLPHLIENSGLRFEHDFKLGYSPERINPGDKNRTLVNILKIVSGSDSQALEDIADVYGHIIEAGIYKAPNIKVAEAAKVIENTQRDLNISLMNELSIIFDKIGIDTSQVIEAAATKWNFLKFYPGLVGGHCISIDPYYLIYKAKKLGYNPEVIAAGRHVNDYMSMYIANKLVKMLISKGKNPGDCKVLVQGITFKENVSDVRNSKVVDLVKQLRSFSIDVEVYDPHADQSVLSRDYGVELTDHVGHDYDGMVLAVAHRNFKSYNKKYLESILKSDGILFDLKGIVKDYGNFDYWRL